MVKIWWGLLGATLLGISSAFMVKTLRHKPAEPALPLMGDMPAFALTDQSGRAVTQNDLKGKTWVVDFIYTTCPDQCPMLSRHMEGLQGLLPKESTIQLVSISVDPTHDTPAVLAQYAKRYHADPSHWRFLTGRPETIQRLQAGLKLAPPNNSPGEKTIDHSSRLILVDAQARVRGYYDATENKDVQRLVKDLSGLSK